ncbi:caspase family protein [Roseomonas sp. SSH11]|uniref:Caspase family protein n=1 Tax=Pararoseomonas baculiformis TaxID=2820812 RepID=A0ABS4ALD5_9PROT|nr:caspase family protein [Pararoseomonas baculiformis]MBP0447838.1 caspase family protein [Pararoseomonas baculiformis]
MALSLAAAAALLPFEGSAQPAAAPAPPSAGAGQPMTIRQASFRKALLIGIEDYAPPEGTTLPDNVLAFRNLTSPCKDIDEIERRLLELGWAFGDIIKVCAAPGQTEVNLRYENLIGVLTRFGEGMTGSDPRSPTNGFGFVYIAAHGVEMLGRSYVLPQQARLDVGRAAKLLQNQSRQAPRVPLFGSGGIDIVDRLFTEVSVGCACDVLLVLDTCRDDPATYTKLNQAISQVAHLNADYTRAPEGLARGRGIMYATGTGRTVSDAASYLRKAFVKHMQIDARLEDVLGNVEQQVTDDSINTPYVQEPIWFYRARVPQFFARTAVQTNQRTDLLPSGALNLRRWQLASRDTRSLPTPGISLAQSASPSEAPPPVAFPQALAPSFPPTQSLPSRDRFGGASPYQGLSEPAPDRSDALLRGGFSVDVYWCVDAEGEDGRRASAEAFAKQLSPSVLKGETVGGAPLARVRVLPLAPQINETAGFRVSNNQIHYEGSVEAATGWAARIRRASSTPFEMRAVRSGVPSLINVFFCAGASTQQTPTRFWLQAAREDQRVLAVSIGDGVRGRLADVTVAGSVEILPDTSPNVSQIRYFFPQDERVAREVAEVASPLLSQPPQVVLVPGYQSRIRPGLLELWLGKQEASPPSLRSIRGGMNSRISP